MNIAQFVEKTGLPRSTISDIENDKHDLTSTRIEKIIRNTGVSGHWLLTGEGEMFAHPEEESGELSIAIPPEKLDLVKAMLEVLASETKYARLLTESIRSLHESIRFTRRIETLEENLHEIQETVTRWSQHTLGKEMDEGQPTKRTAGLEDPPVKDHQK